MNIADSDLVNADSNSEKVTEEVNADMDYTDGCQMLIDLDTVQRKYLQLSRKKIRNIVTTYLRTLKVGNKILVDRKQLEAFLSDPDRDYLI